MPLWSRNSSRNFRLCLVDTKDRCTNYPGDGCFKLILKFKQGQPQCGVKFPYCIDSAKFDNYCLKDEKRCGIFPKTSDLYHILFTKCPMEMSLRLISLVKYGPEAHHLVAFSQIFPYRGRWDFVSFRPYHYLTLAHTAYQIKYGSAYALLFYFTAQIPKDILFIFKFCYNHPSYLTNLIFHPKNPPFVCIKFPVLFVAD